MSDILLDIPGILNKNKSFVLCIVIATQGSSPRKAGSKMVVFSDSTIMGTIGGGSIENQAIVKAQEVLSGRKPLVQTYQLEADLAMQCGGSVTLYFEPFFPNPDVYIFGAGHVGREVGRYAAENGFNIHFVDFRGEIYREFDSSFAHCITDDYLSFAHNLECKENDFLIVMTPNHEFDEKLTYILGKKRTTYMGVIGSKRKVAEIRKRALETNALTEEELNHIDMPIGIPFNAQTPREIAISIVAKIIDVKNNLNK